MEPRFFDSKSYNWEGGYKTRRWLNNEVPSICFTVTIPYTEKAHFSKIPPIMYPFINQHVSFRLDVMENV